jgi:diaminopimelate epimerase
MRFEKWHGIGNAYLVIAEDELPDPSPAQVERICHPDLGAGSDGILLVGPSGRADARVRIFNPDGSEAEFSGNGTRIAVGHLAARRGLAQLRLETLKGVVEGSVHDGVVTVDAGAAALEAPDHRPDGGAPPAERYTFVSLGNPHCVIEMGGERELRTLDLAAVGPPIERHAWFPNRTNVEFYLPLAQDRIAMRVWERGAGETRSSGSGASAAAVAAVVAGRARSPVTVELDGGSLQVEVGADLVVRLTGPVEAIASGRFEDAFLARLEAL